MCRAPARYIDTQRGASLVEFSIVGLGVILSGLFTLQLGLLYHAKTTLNYAVFEAARAGAVNNARMSAIRGELGIRLAPLQGGDGSRKSALAAIVKSSAWMLDTGNTRIAILNPTEAAFRDWAVRDPVTGKRFIPVNHLRHQTYAIGRHSGLSLRDATILKLQVTHGVDLRVPVVGKLMAAPMKWIDSSNAGYYQRGKWPLRSVATVRMQSDSLEDEVLKGVSVGTRPSGNSGQGPAETPPSGIDTAEESSSGNDAQNADVAGSNVNQNDRPVFPDDQWLPDSTAQTPDAAADPCNDPVPGGFSLAEHGRAAGQMTESHNEPLAASPHQLIKTSVYREMLARKNAPNHDK